MNTERSQPKNIDEYIAAFPADVRKVLQKMRSTIGRAAPDASETISYQMPTFKLNGRVLIHFAAFKHHIGLFPPVRGDAELMRDVSIYAGPKGNLRFPLDKPVPYGLVNRIVKVRRKESAEKAKARP